MAVSEAARLLAAGVPVTLRDGREYRLVFDFEALCVIEKDVGGLDAFAEALGDPARRLRTVLTGMVAGLTHTKLSRAEVVALLEYQHTLGYLDAMTDAFLEAMPPSAPGEVANPKAQGSRGRSPGLASTGQRRSGTAAPTRRSGG